ncbi:MAG: calmodulin-binding protein [Pirellulales bacterium]|nr:calmodulin-binding protein [Pirellulales bacterium]
MIRRTVMVLLCAAAVLTMLSVVEAQAQQAYGRQWGRSYSTQDWNRLYYYPYVFYPQNFWGTDYYRSSEDLYFRYPPEMRVPVYNQQWHNYYPQHRYDGCARQHQMLPACGKIQTGVKYHKGHHFILDTF